MGLLNIDEILSRLKGVKNYGKYYMACCPAHKDKNPSLSISEKNGNVILHCFAGCSDESICEALGVSKEDLKPKKQSTYNTEKKYMRKRSHVYIDETGKPIAVKFVYTKADGSKWCEWNRVENNGTLKKGLSDLNIPLYNLSTVKEEANTIYIVEGEKDADTVTSMGFVATTFPHHAWKDEYVNYLKGKNIIVIKDIDEAGERYANQAVNAVLPIAKTVKKIDPATMCEGLPDNGDISDVTKILGAEKAKQALENAVSTASIITQKAENVNPKWLITGFDKYDNIKSYAINEPLYAEQFKENNRLFYVNGKFYSENGVIPKEAIKQKIQYEISPYFKKGVSTKVIHLLEAIENICYTEPLPPKTDRIYCTGKTLILSPEGIEEDTTDTTFSFNRLNAEYNKNAPAPKAWLKYLSDMLYEEDILTLQEYLGYCFIPTTIAQKALFIVGQGREGKSRIGVLLSNIMGFSLISDKLQKLEDDRFLLARLENRLVFYDDDLNTRKMTDTGTFKSLVTNDITVQAEAKGKDKFDLKPYVRFLSCGNTALSSCFDRSDGFYRRLLILTCKPITREEKDDDKKLTEKLLSEKDSIFKWCIDGLVRLVKNGYNFTISDRAKTTLDNLKNDENNIVQFISDKSYFDIEEENDNFVSSRDLLILYKIWCYENGLEPLADRTFSIYLKENCDKLGMKYVDQHYIIEHTHTKLPLRRKYRGYENIIMSDVAKDSLLHKNGYPIKL